MKEISIIVENRAGILAEIAELMAKGDINIENIGVETVGNTGIVVMKVDKYDLALRLLRDASFNAVTEESLLIKLKDEPGALAKIAKRFRDASINIRSLHIISRDSGYSFVAISSEQSEKAKELVRDVLFSTKD